MMRWRDATAKWLLFIAGLVAQYLREPRFFLQPRLWAEEGTRYYVYAYRYALGPLWYKGLVNVQRGYVALWPNLASTIAANLAPIRHVPLVTTLMAFAIQLIPPALIVWSKAKFWASPLRKVIGMLVCLLTPISGEIWLNTINSQFYLALAAILVLIEPADSERQRKWAHRLLLVLAGLTGPVSSILAPVYASLAWLTKDRERRIQAALLGVCAFIQVGLLVSYSASDASIGMRVSDHRVYLLIFSMWTQSVGLVLCGMDCMAKLAAWIIAGYEAGGILIALAWVGLAVLLTVLFWWLSAHLSIRHRVLFLGSYFLVLGVSYVGSLTQDKLNLINPGGAGRYFWVPNVVFALMLMANAFDWARSRFRACLCATMLLIVLAWGGVSYRATLMASWEWPQWRAEITSWEADPAYKIRIWPPGWQITLRRAP